MPGRLIFALCLAFAVSFSVRATAKPKPKPKPNPQTATTTFRFDAMRFTGALSGPHALVALGRKHSGKTPSLLQLRRRFISRIFETIEAPSVR